MSKVVLITGAGSGIGRAIAIGVADSMGAECIICAVGRRLAKVQETAAAIRTKGAAASAYSADVRSLSELEEMLMEVQRDHGTVDILINNAGMFPPKSPLALASLSDWDNVFATNVRGPFLLMRGVLPQMVAQDYGRVINVSAPIKHLPLASAYCATKMALDSLTKSTAFELRGKNVTVNAIEPPFCDTEMHVGGKDPSVVVPHVMELINTTSATGKIVKIE